MISSSSMADEEEADPSDAEPEAEVEIVGGALSVPVMMELSSLRSESWECECEAGLSPEWAGMLDERSAG